MKDPQRRRDPRREEGGRFFFCLICDNGQTEEYVTVIRDGAFICAVFPHDGGTRSAPLRSTAPHLLLLRCCCCLVFVPGAVAPSAGGRGNCSPELSSGSHAEVSLNGWRLSGGVTFTRALNPPGESTPLCYISFTLFALQKLQQKQKTRSQPERWLTN